MSETKGPSISHIKERLGIMERNLQLHEHQLAGILKDLEPSVQSLGRSPELSETEMLRFTQMENLYGYCQSVSQKIRKCREELRTALADRTEAL